MNNEELKDLSFEDALLQLENIVKAAVSNWTMPSRLMKKRLCSNSFAKQN